MKISSVPSILVICLSPAVDRNYTLPELTPGGFHRCSNPVISAGGKGVNVARVLSLLGADVKLTGFFAGSAGQFILHDLRMHGISAEPVFLPGETRSSINILERDHARETEILEQGPEADRKALDQIKEVIGDSLSGMEKGTCVVFSGGIPFGLEADTYTELMVKASSLGGKCFLDTSAEALMHGITAGPFFIKPNIREFSSVTGFSPLEEGRISDVDIAQISQAAGSLDIPVTAVTLSDKGAVLCTDDCTYFAHPMPVIPVNTIGSGDSFTAGFTYGIATGEDMHGSLALAVACAASNAVFEKVGHIDPADVKELRKQVIIDRF